MVRRNRTVPNHVKNRITCDPSIFDAYCANGKFDFNLVIPQPEALVVDDVDMEVILIAEIAMGKIDFNASEPAGGRVAALDRKDYGSLSQLLHVNSATRALLERKLANQLDDRRYGQFLACLNSIRATGCASWYDWNVKHWGTKWNAYNCKRVGPTVCVFETAWRSPQPVVCKVFQSHNCDMLHEWADEDTGRNVGRVTYAAGHSPVSEEWSNTKEGFELAFDLFGGKPDYYRYNETLGTYEYIETFDVE
jgi:hypothetical protein